MSVPADDSENRARSIFERLRAEQGGQDQSESPSGPPPGEPNTPVADTQGGPGTGNDSEPRHEAEALEPERSEERELLSPLPTAPPSIPPADIPPIGADEGEQGSQTSDAEDQQVTASAGGGGGPVAPTAVVDAPIHADAEVSVAPATDTEVSVAPATDAVVDAGLDPDADRAPSPLPGDDVLAQVSPPVDVPERPVRPLPRIIAVANQKGGVGKTTTAVNLGASLAELGHRVLVVDLDPQGNATTGLGINSRNLERSIYDVILHDTPIEDCIEPTTLRNLFVAPATIDLAGAEIELVPAFSRELRLRRALERIAGDFDFTLIDCPPSLGLLTINGLAAADEVLVPIQCEYYALEGLGQLLRNVTLVQGNLNPRLEVANIVLTMYDARTRLAEQVAQEVRDHFGATVCRNVVPRTVRLSEAPSFGQPIIVFDPSSRGSIAYRELAKEVVGGTS